MASVTRVGSAFLLVQQEFETDNVDDVSLYQAEGTELRYDSSEGEESDDASRVARLSCETTVRVVRLVCIDVVMPAIFISCVCIVATLRVLLKASQHAGLHGIRPECSLMHTRDDATGCSLYDVVCADIFRPHRTY